MKIVVVGATGRVGTAVVSEAARRGHQVLAVSRHEPAGALPAGVSWHAADAADPAPVAELAAGADAVVAAHGPSRKPGEDPNAFAGQLLALARAVAPVRISVVGGAGSLLAEPGLRLVDAPGFPTIYRTEALAHADSLTALQESGDELNWTYLSPAPEIDDGPRTGGYRSAQDTPAGSSISFADYAIALVDELEQGRQPRRRWTVATS